MLSSPETAHEKLTGDLQMHFLELAKRSPDDDADPRLLRWARLFAARDEASFTALTQEDPTIMARATQTLAALSGDPTTRTAAEERKMSKAFEAAGFAAAEARGEARGREETLRMTVGILCRALGIAFTTARQKRVATMSGERLEDLVRDLEAERAWPGRRSREG